MFIGLAAQGESTAVQQRARCTISPGDDSEVGGTREREEPEEETTTPSERGSGRKENNNNPTFQLLPVASPSRADRQTDRLNNSSRNSQAKKNFKRIPHDLTFYIARLPSTHMEALNARIVGGGPDLVAPSGAVVQPSNGHQHSPTNQSQAGSVMCR